MLDNTVKSNQSVEKVLDILETMAIYGRPIRLQDLSNKLNMSAPTVYRFLKTLIKSGYVIQDEDSSKYYLTFKICYIANLVQDQLNIRDIAYPFLKELAVITEETASLVIEQDGMAVYIDKVEGPDKLVKSFQRIGHRTPLYCTGVGKLFLSEMEDSVRDNILSRGMEKLTPNTITDANQLLKELINIRNLSYAVDNEECEIGAICLAAPIRDYRGKIVSAVSVSGPVSRMTNSKMKEIKAHILKASMEISKALGYKCNYTK